ncbi:MAG: hypothetical protein KatS3mg105_1736 [Gemmatales bacterium]|nr:MAG: hypothetical protein KatS3mg105_1736 [Gemmatales bacterium]
MIDVVEQDGNCILPVRVQPGARKNAAVGEHGGALKLAVTAPPEQGRANRAVIELLCALLDLKRSQIELLSGATSRDKKFLLRGVTAEALRAKLPGS